VNKIHHHKPQHIVQVQHRRGCHTKSCDKRADKSYNKHHEHDCSNSNVMACIRNAAAKYHQSLGDAIRVASCESSFDPHNSYLGHYGLYQFLQSTFDSTIYRGKDIWSAKWNALAAMWMWAHHRRSEWACQ